MSASFNIILFGETGVGMSSVINLIAGRRVADTSPDVHGCTMSFTPYTFPVNGRTIHIWDTAGLDEPDTGVNGFLPAIEQAYELIRQLSKQGGVDLLLFCIRGNRVTATVQSNYRLFYEVLCGSRVPIALVITHLEKEANMEDWWMRNAESLAKYGIKPADHACVTGLPTHSKYRESRRNIARLLDGCHSDGRFTMPPADRRFTMPPQEWFVEFLRLFGLSATSERGSDAKKHDIIKILTKRCKLDPMIADELATKLAMEEISQ